MLPSRGPHLPNLKDCHRAHHTLHLLSHHHSSLRTRYRDRSLSHLRPHREWLLGPLVGLPPSLPSIFSAEITAVTLLIASTASSLLA